MAKEFTAALGGRNYTVAALPIAPSRVWREKASKEFDVILKAFSVSFNFETSQIGELAILLQAVVNTLKRASDQILDLLFEYAPNLKAEREWIEHNATDEEALAVFQEVLKLAFPFGVLLELVTGRTGSKTLSNSPSPNGVSALPASGPVKRKK